MFGRFLIYLRTSEELPVLNEPSNGVPNQAFSLSGRSDGYAPNAVCAPPPSAAMGNAMGNQRCSPDNIPFAEGDCEIGGNRFVDRMISMFDSNNDGFLTKSEAKRAASHFDINSRELKGALKLIGIGRKKETIPLDPMGEQIKRICVEKFKKAAFKHFFNYMDTDKSGTISISEVLSAVRAFDVPVSASLAKQIFDSVDSNNDGEIDFKEFLAFLASAKEVY